MAGTPRKRERRERLAQFLIDEEAFDQLCVRIASGDNLVAFCRELDIPYVAVKAWIYEDEGRRKEYEAAIGTKEQHDRDLVTGALTQILTLDPARAFPNNAILAAIPEEVRQCIASIEFGDLPNAEGQLPIKKIRFWDKNKASETFAKVLKMLTEKHEHTGKDGAPMEVVAVRYPERAPTAEAWAERQKRRQLPPAEPGAVPDAEGAE